MKTFFLISVFLAVSIYLYKEKQNKEDIIEALKECENETVLDKILDRYRDKMKE